MFLAAQEICPQEGLEHSCGRMLFCMGFLRIFDDFLLETEPDWSFAGFQHAVAAQKSCKTGAEPCIVR